MHHHGVIWGGHYTAHAKNPEDDSWCNFDDASVTPATEARVGQSSDAYILFYQRRRAPAQSPPQPAQDLPKFAPDTRVVAVGLQNEAMNGRRGVVADSQSSSPGRLPVRFDGESKNKSIKEENLTHEPTDDIVSESRSPTYTDMDEPD